RDLREGVARGGHVDRDDLRAVAREGAGDRGADPARRARDDRDAAREGGRPGGVVERGSAVWGGSTVGRGTTVGPDREELPRDGGGPRREEESDGREGRGARGACAVGDEHGVARRTGPQLLREGSHEPVAALPRRGDRRRVTFRGRGPDDDD